MYTLSRINAVLCFIAAVPYLMTAMAPGGEYALVYALRLVPYVALGFIAAATAWRNNYGWPIVTIGFAVSALALQSVDILTLSYMDLHQKASNPVLDVFTFKWDQALALAEHGAIRLSVGTISHFFISPLAEIVVLALSVVEMVYRRRNRNGRTE